MEISEVRVYPVKGQDDKLKAYANITIDNAFVVTGLRIVNGEKGLFVSYPSRRMADGTYKDIAHPLDNTTRKAIEDKVLAAYKAKLEEPGPSTDSDKTF